MVAPASPRSQFNGVLTVGVVTVPVKLVTAVRAERIGFHLLHDQDHVRLKQTMVCPNHGEVHPEHRIKGYEVSPDNYVIVQDEDLEAARPAKSRDITVDCFVKPEQIDPRHFEKPYYLLPGEHGAKNYRVLVEAMKNTGLLAIAQFVLRDKEYLAAIRPVEDVLALYTMRYADELVDPVYRRPRTRTDADVACAPDATARRLGQYLFGSRREPPRLDEDMKRTPDSFDLRRRSRLPLDRRRQYQALAQAVDVVDVRPRRPGARGLN